MLTRDELFVWVDAHSKSEESAAIIKAAVDRYTTAVIAKSECSAILELFQHWVTKEQIAIGLTSHPYSIQEHQSNIDALSLVIKIIKYVQAKAMGK